MWERIEKIFIICALLFCAGAFIPLLSPHSEQISDEKPQSTAMAMLQRQANSKNNDPTQPNPAVLVCQVFIYAGVGVMLFIHRKQALLYIRNSKLLWAIVALAFLSVLWSDVPGFAFRRCLNMAATSGFGLYLACRYSPRELLRLIGYAFAIAVLGSILIVLLRPDLGIDSELTNYAWKGVFIQKNTLGRFMALGVLVFLFLRFDSQANRWVYSISSVICVGMILAARSVTSALALPILLSLVWLFALSRRRPFPFVLALVIFAAAGIACVLTLFIDPSDILTLAGRDSTMSGRLDIWSAVVPKIMAHPWLGYGYSSFWLGTEGQASSDLWSMLHWNVPHSHNGFFDLAEELGVVGLGIFIAGFIMSANRGLRWARNQQALIGLWPLTYLSFMLFFNLSEGSILRQDNLFWVLYVATFVFVMNKTSDPIPETLQESATNSWFSLRAPFVSTGSARENMGIQ